MYHFTSALQIISIMLINFALLRVPLAITIEPLIVMMGGSLLHTCAYKINVNYNPIGIATMLFFFYSARMLRINPHDDNRTPSGRLIYNCYVHAHHMYRYIIM